MGLHLFRGLWTPTTFQKYPVLRLSTRRKSYSLPFMPPDTTDPVRYVDGSQMLCMWSTYFGTFFTMLYHLVDVLCDLVLYKGFGSHQNSFVWNLHGTRRSGVLPVTYAAVRPSYIGDVQRPSIRYPGLSLSGSGLKYSHSLHRCMVTHHKSVLHSHEWSVVGVRTMIVQYQHRLSVGRLAKRLHLTSVSHLSIVHLLWMNPHMPKPCTSLMPMGILDKGIPGTFLLLLRFLRSWLHRSQ